MTKAEKKLKNYNKVLARSRARHALYFALSLSLGFFIAHLFIGDAMEWLQYGLPLSFVLVFTLAYGFSTQRKVRENARKLVEKTGAGEVAQTPPSRWIDWALAAIVTLLLVSPILFRGVIVEGMLDYQASSVVDIELVNEEGHKKTLHVPALYLVGKGRGPVSSFMELGMYEPSISASIKDSGPAVRESVEASRQIFKDDIMTIQFVNKQGPFFLVNEESIYKPLLSTSLAFADKAESSYIYYEVKTVKVPDPKDRRAYHIDMKVGTPTDSQLRAVRVICKGAACTVVANDPAGLMHVTFSSVREDRWLEIYRKASALIADFAKAPEVLHE